MDKQLRTIKHRTITESHNDENNNQQQNNCLSQWGGGVNAFYWYQISALDSTVVEAHKNVKLAWRLQSARTTVISHKVRKGDKDQESTQSSTTPDYGYHMGK